jgi:hypothetical protein
VLEVLVEVVDVAGEHCAPGGLDGPRVIG